MFKILKKKVNDIVSNISKNVTEKDEDKPKKEAKVKKEVKVKAKKEVKVKPKKLSISLPKKITERKINEKDLKDVLEDLELSLLESDVAFEVSEKIKEDLKKNLIGKDARRGKIKDEVKTIIRNSLMEILDLPKIDLKRELKKKPYLIVFLGFNGAGKTTTIAKISNLLKKQGFSSVLAAGDSFRAASIEQLEVHGKKLDVNVIKHKYGADPAAIVFDAVKHAESKNINVVLADTAGRVHTNKNLMDQLAKICRVNKPDLKILVVDSITGNDVIEQAQMFDEIAGIDAVIFTKLDVNPKGGAILSVAYLLKKPVMFVGTGQEYEDLKEFDRKWFVDQILE